MRVKRVQGKYVSVYIPDHLVEKWEQLKEKSKFVQEALVNETKNLQQ